MASKPVKNEAVCLEDIKAKALETTRFLPGAGTLMEMLVNRAVRLYGMQLVIDAQTEALDPEAEDFVDQGLILWSKERQAQYAFLKTVDLIFKQAKIAVAAAGLGESTITAIVDVIEKNVTNEEEKLAVIKGLKVISDALNPKQETFDI